MKILALESYYGGSHKAFIDGWISRSRHDWSLFTLPDSKWKWRMRHSAVTFADHVNDALNQGEEWDVLFCSDMLNLAEFIGLCPRIGQTPSICYFHENQLAYPVEYEREWDYHFPISNMTSALAASQVWFNSAYNRDSFLGELELFLKRMPDNKPLGAIETIRAKSQIHHPCISLPSNTHTPTHSHTHAHILWAARWERDKNPQMFFDAVNELAARGLDFRLSVIGGGNSRNVLPIFEDNRVKHKERIINWGYMDSMDEYLEVLTDADIAVSTAIHEFFGISMAECASAGCFPLVPDTLAYPELLNIDENPDFYYNNTLDGLISRLEVLCKKCSAGELWDEDPERGSRTVEKYAWETNVPVMDEALEKLQVTSNK